MSEHKFPYYYEQDTEDFTFYRVPKQLMTDPMFQGLSAEAKFLYAILLDRMQLSRKNGWFDEQGRVYLYFTVENIMKLMQCGNKKACRLLAELDDCKGVGLVTRVRQGLCKPDKLYVHQCVFSDMSKQHLQTCQNDTSGSVKTTSLDMSKQHPNNTDKNKTECNDTESIDSFFSEEAKRTEAIASEEYEEYLYYFEYQLQMSDLRQEYPNEDTILQEILELIVDTVCSKRKTIRIAGEDRPADIVKSRFMKLNAEHIRFVLLSFQENTTRVRNIKQYLLTSLYNATMTMDSYYAARVRHDFYGTENVDKTQSFY